MSEPTRRTMAITWLTNLQEMPHSMVTSFVKYMTVKQLIPRIGVRVGSVRKITQIVAEAYFYPGLAFISNKRRL